MESSPSTSSLWRTRKISTMKMSMREQQLLQLSEFRKTLGASSCCNNSGMIFFILVSITLLLGIVANIMLPLTTSLLRSPEVSSSSSSDHNILEEPKFRARNRAPGIKDSRDQLCGISSPNCCLQSQISTSSKSPSTSSSSNNSSTAWHEGGDTGSESTSRRRPKDRHHVFQNMSATYNFMTDDDLLWMATRTSQRSRGAPPKHIPRIAFMFLVRGSLPFARLWERYFLGHEQLYSIYVHANPSYIPDDVPMSSPFYGRFIRSEVVRWARISMYNAERRLLGNALLDYRNEWFVLLSEACIPLNNFRNTYKYITNSRLSFVESYPDPDLLKAEGGLKNILVSAADHAGRLSAQQARKMAPEISRQNFRKGSQWFQINRELAMLLAADTKYYDKFALFFCKSTDRAACFIDEHYLPTAAALWLPDKLAYRTLTYVHFRGQAPHPDHWDKTRMSKSLIRRLRHGHNCTCYSDAAAAGPQRDSPSQRKSSSSVGCYFFARKFDADALEPLLEIATEVMGIQALSSDFSGKSSR